MEEKDVSFGECGETINHQNQLLNFYKGNNKLETYEKTDDSCCRNTKLAGDETTWAF